MEVMAASGTKRSLCRPSKPSGNLSRWPRFPFPAMRPFLLPELLPTRACGPHRIPHRIVSLFAGTPNKTLCTMGDSHSPTPSRRPGQKGPRRDFAKLPSMCSAEADSGLDLRFPGPWPHIERNSRDRQVS